MKTRRHSSITLLMVASVFLSLLVLLTSCGVPTYFVPKFSVTTSDSTEDESATFSFTYTPDSTITTTSSDHAGLLLLYYYGNSSLSSTDRSNIIKAFRSNYIINTNDGRVVSPDSIDDPVVTYTSTDGTSTYDVYAFTLNGSLIQAPTYNYSIDIDETYSTSVTLTYNDPDTTVTGDEYVSYQDDNALFTMQFDSSFVPAGDKYIWVFAAISAQGESFSNIYWSDLKYAGHMVIPSATSEE